MKLSKLAFLFWFIFIAKESFIYLFFQSNPGRGTLFSSALELSVFYLLLIFELHIKKTSKVTAKNTSLIWLIIFFSIYQGVSLLWAHPSSFFVSFSYWIVIFLELLFIWNLSKLIPTDVMFEKSLKGFIYGALFLTCITLTSRTDDGRLGDGDFLHPNVIGNLFAISAICCLYIAMKSNKKKIRNLYVVYFLYLASFLFATLSKSAILAFGVSMVVFLLISRIKLRTKLITLVTLSALVLAFYNKFYSYLMYYSQLGGGKVASTFSGRTIIWDAVKLKIKERPIIGHGFFSFRDYGPQPFEIRIGSAHNEFLNILFNFGVIGLLFCILIYLLYIVYAFRSLLTKDNISRSAGTVSILLFVYFMTRGLTEGHPTGTIFIIQLLFTVSIFLSSIVLNKKQKTLSKEPAKGVA